MKPKKAPKKNKFNTKPNKNKPMSLHPKKNLPRKFNRRKPLINHRNKQKRRTIKLRLTRFVFVA